MIARTRTTLAAWSIAICAAAVPMTLPAQTTGADTSTARSGASYSQGGDTDRDHGSNWGWIGLIGLAGLLGMRRREPEVRTDRTYDRTADRSTTGTTGTTTGRV